MYLAPLSATVQLFISSSQCFDLILPLRLAPATRRDMLLLRPALRLLARPRVPRFTVSTMTSLTTIGKTIHNEAARRRRPRDRGCDRGRVSSSQATAAVAEVEAATWRWVDSWVVGMGLCPFAAPVRSHQDSSGRPALRCAVSTASSVDDLRRSVRAELDLLAPGIASVNAGIDAPAARQMPESTLLVIAPQDGSRFLSDYRDFVHASWDVQEEIVAASLQSSLQVVLFHPKAVHSLYGEAAPLPDLHCGGAPDSFDSAATNFSICSPHPTFHFLREADILAAIQSGYPQPEQIPARNARKLAALGSVHLRREWHAKIVEQDKLS